MLTLGELRRARGLSQADEAKRMSSTQSDGSKLERRTDVRLSTLRAYVELGAELEIVSIDRRTDQRTRLVLG